MFGIWQERAMDIETVMVHLELERPNEGLLALAADLATRLGAAHLIGIASCQPIQLVYADSYATGDIMAADREEIEVELKKVEQRFHETCKGKVKRLEWRSNVTCGPLADYIASEARAADLIVTGPDIGGSMFDHARQVRIADLVFQAGRPMLMVPKACTYLDLGHVLIGWKETPECRRAVADALPLLKLAGRVSVITIASEEELAPAKGQVKDVVEWLLRHGVKANGDVIAHKGDDVQRFARLVQEKSPGLVVAGAYGHSRLREWALGGVTGDYLINPDRPVLLSH
jgi:nucleotide-binding universal stress UspA family protein